MEWEKVNACDTSITEKLKVEGGYLYRVVLFHNGGFQLAMSFVPLEEPLMTLMKLDEL